MITVTLLVTNLGVQQEQIEMEIMFLVSQNHTNFLLSTSISIVHDLRKISPDEDDDESDKHI